MGPLFGRCSLQAFFCSTHATMPFCCKKSSPTLNIAMPNYLGLFSSKTGSIQGLLASLAMVKWLAFGPVEDWHLPESSHIQYPTTRKKETTSGCYWLTKLFCKRRRGFAMGSFEFFGFAPASFASFGSDRPGTSRFLAPGPAHWTPAEGPTHDLDEV